MKMINCETLNHTNKNKIIMLKIIAFLTFTLLFFFTSYSEEATDTRTKYQIIDDSVHFTDGRVISYEQFSKENPEIVEDSKENKKVNKNENTEVEDGRIISSWKFYTIMLTFPVFLILLFILVFIRGRRKDK